MSARSSHASSPSRTVAHPPLRLGVRRPQNFRAVSARHAQGRLSEQQQHVAPLPRLVSSSAVIEDPALRLLREISEEGKRNFLVERSHVSIHQLSRLNDVCVVPTRPRPTHSAGVKRCYTPLWEAYKRSLLLPSDMSDDERDLVRRLRQDPFRRHKGVPKITNLERSVAGNSSWSASTHVAHSPSNNLDIVEEPRPSSTPRALKASHKGIRVTPVGKMVNDISFRHFHASGSSHDDESLRSSVFGGALLRANDTAMSSTVSSPRSHSPVGSARQEARMQSPDKKRREERRVVSLEADNEIPAPPRMASPAGWKAAASIDKPSGSAIPTDVVEKRVSSASHMQAHRHSNRAHAVVCGDAMTPADLELERMRTLASFNDLKRAAMLIATIPTNIEVMTAEMFVRIEDDFLRVTRGRKSRILTPDDFIDDIKLGGNVFTRQRLMFLMGKESGGALTFVQLFQYAFPCVSSAQLDGFMIRLSTSMNAILGGPIEVRAAADVYRSIRQFYLKFDSDGDGVVTIEDIVSKQQSLFDAGGEGGGGDDPVDFESASSHVRYNPQNGAVSLESFAIFCRFLFPPYRLIDEWQRI